jgi:hypothetical protein
MLRVLCHPLILFCHPHGDSDNYVQYTSKYEAVHLSFHPNLAKNLLA